MDDRIIKLMEKPALKNRKNGSTASGSPHKRLTGRNWQILFTN
jgi:hypothetical protein